MPQLTGTGTMGAAIAAFAAKGGRSVQSLGSVDTATAVTGDVVVACAPPLASGSVGAVPTTVLVAA
jgi:hypothetical protein